MSDAIDIGKTLCINSIVIAMTVADIETLLTITLLLLSIVYTVYKIYKIHKDGK